MIVQYLLEMTLNPDTIMNLIFNLQECMQYPVSFHAEVMGDITHIHQALQQQDVEEFAQAVTKGVNSYVKQKHWRLIKRRKVPEGMDPPPMPCTEEKIHLATT